MSNVVGNKMKISFDSNWFKSKYYVYVITIGFGKETFYYVGQTGDRKYTAARSPFYRLWGHFNPYNTKKGTDTQLMKNLFSKGLLIDQHDTSRRQIIDTAIHNKTLTITTDFYPIEDFLDDNASIHTSKRKRTEAIEVAVINQFDSKRLFNDLDKIGHKKVVISEEESNIAKEIYNDIIQNITE